VGRDACGARESVDRADAGAHHDEVCVDCGPVAEDHALPSDPRDRLAEMKDSAAGFVQPAQKFTDLLAQHPSHRDGVAADDVYLESARTQRRGDFQCNEAGAKNDGALRRTCAVENCATVGPRSQIEHAIRLGAGNLQTHRFCTGGEQQPIESQLASALQSHLVLLHVELAH
jgi:hypothetical protein